MKKAVRITLAYVLTCVFVLTGVLALAAPMRAIAEETSAQGPAATTTVDPDTRDRWKHWTAGGGDESRLSTQNVGRIWTDKTVEAAGDEDQSNFLTTLSVMSSTSNTTVTQSMPLDIVLVLDVSGSMDDPMGSTDSTKRVDALKTAAGSFIDTIAKQNEGLSAEKQHQVAIVKFAGDENNGVGNGKYRDGGYTYNYTQVMKRLSVCNSGSSSSFKDTVNKIDPSGSTRADNGMKLAQLELKTYGRANAKKIVVFFTDGKPTSRSDFDPTVASNAVSTAKAMKDSGTTIYTIGIFAGANPKADPTKYGTSDENKFMHAVSSNYPAATSYTSDKLGARAQDSDYYQSAATSSELKKVFEGISQSITTGAGYPTHIEEGFEARESGYITFTDTLGDFMQVDSFRSAQISGATFPTAAKTSHGNVDTYEFSGAAHDLVITVERAGEDNPRQGDKVTVQVPASLIPLREYKVDEAKGTFEVADIGSVMPLRVTYASSVKAAARDHLFEPGDTPGLSDYIDENWDREADTLSFLANKWSGGKPGDTIASFQPSSTNGYYYFQKATPLYTDEACTRRATRAPQDGETYYYKDEYVAQGKDGKPQDAYTVIAVDGGAIASFKGALTIEGGGYAFAKGTARLAFINQLHTEKTAVGDNATGTAHDVLNPRWNDDASVSNATHIESRLGNNGRITLSLATTPAELDTKAGFGLGKKLNGRDWADGDSFTFELAAVTEGAPMPERTTATVTAADVADGRAAFDFGTITYNATGSYEYEVREQNAGQVVNGMTYSANVARVRVSVVDDAATGKLVATPSLISGSATFENGYSVELDYDAKGGLSIAKTLVGASAEAGKFSFTVTPEGDDVLGIAGTYASPALTDGVAATIAATSGQIVFTQRDAGKSWGYTVTESDPGAGFTCDGATWNIRVSVADDPAAGRLSVTTVATGGGAEQSWTYTSDAGRVEGAPNVINFVNRYSAGGATTAISGTKTLTGRQMADGEFSFELAYAADPANVVARAGNAGGTVDFGSLSYTTDSLRQLVADGLASRTGTGWSVGYVAREATAGLADAGIAAQASTFGVTVNVTDNGDGTLTCDVAYPDGGLAFVNEYQPTEATISLTGTKSLNVPEGLTGPADITGKFTFTVTGEEGAPMPERTSATNDGSGTVDFGGITFTLENTFGGAQTQAEDVADEEAAKKDAAAPLDTPVVADDGAAGKKGAADEAPEIMGEDSEAEGATDLAPVPDADAQELNAEPDTEADSVPETEPDPAPLAEEEPAPLAEEEPAPLADTPVVQEAPAEELAPVAAVARWTPKRSAIRLAVNDGKVDGAQVVADDPALETDPQADAGIAAAPAAQAPGPRSRIFRYVVTESGSLPGVANDARASRDVYIKVTDDGAGHLSAEFVDGPDVASARHLDAPDLAFINTYDVTGTSASITARKSLEGRDLVAGEFEFALMGADGQTVLTATNDADGNVSFDAIEYTAPGTYTYTIRELVPAEPRGGVKYDGRSVQVSVTVTDDGEGHLVAKAEYAADAVFENTYTAAPADVMISAKKVLRGAALARGRFTFLLTGEVDGKAVELTATNDADGNVAFPHLVFENAGTYTFKVSEVNGKEDRVTYDKHAYAVTVEVKDNGEGQLVATVTNDAKGGALVFMNTYTPPSTPTGTTTPTRARNTAGRTPKTGDDLLAATTLTLLATVGGVIVAIAVRLARRRREF